MKMKILVLFAVIATVMSACGHGAIRFCDTDQVEAAVAQSDAAASIAESQKVEGTFETKSEPEELPIADDATRQETETVVPDSPKEEPTDEPVQATPLETTVPERPEVVAPAPAETPAPKAPELSYGGIPFDLAANTGTWWQIDSSDSAYWAVQENINAIRAAGGLGGLDMDSGLSSIAGSRCQSFVEGGPFDHSGMVTKSEICASGPLKSAGAVCGAWQNSPAHYANIMRTDISRMGVGCWFCEMDGQCYTYWTVTFE